jgi:hypothetical protein
MILESIFRIVKHYLSNVRAKSKDKQMEIIDNARHLLFKKIHQKLQRTLLKKLKTGSSQELQSKSSACELYMGKTYDI